MGGRSINVLRQHLHRVLVECLWTRRYHVSALVSHWRYPGRCLPGAGHPISPDATPESEHNNGGARRSNGLCWIFTVNIDISGLTKLTGVGIIPSDVRAVITPLFNTFGTLALVGGAVYSAFIFWRKRILPHRVVANILIALGALLPAAGGIHISVNGNLNLFFLFELAGVIIMFIGFLRTKEVFGLYRFPLVHGFKKVEEVKGSESTNESVSHLIK